MFKKNEHGKWEYDYDVIVAKTNQKFAQEIREIFYIEQGDIRFVDVVDDDMYISILILAFGFYYEILFQKYNKKYCVNYISIPAIKKLLESNVLK